jgi:TfoX/Sxy family transcriptional regulator of competence genes
MEKEKIVELERALDKATKDLTQVIRKKMFGCHALWANDNVFALVWKHGRIGVKLPDEKYYKTLLEKAGAEPWKAGTMQMAHWILVPETYHKKAAELKKWTARAYEQCILLEKKAKKRK